MTILFKFQNGLPLYPAKYNQPLFLSLSLSLSLSHTHKVSVSVWFSELSNGVFSETHRVRAQAPREHSPQ